MSKLCTSPQIRRLLLASKKLGGGGSTVPTTSTSGGVSLPAVRGLHTRYAQHSSERRFEALVYAQGSPEWPEYAHIFTVLYAARARLLSYEQTGTDRHDDSVPELEGLPAGPATA